MPKPDVRVRLSAEGVEEVVASLRKIALESKNASAEPAQGFLELNDILEGTTELLGSLGLVLSVIGFSAFIKGAVDSATEIYSLGLKVGATTENLSALDLAAQLTGSTLDAVGRGLGRQNKFIDAAIRGNNRALATLSDLKIGLEDFKGKDSVEGFEVLARAITKIPDAAVRGGTAIRIFGKSGQELLPVMKKLADEGLLNLIKRADELGVLMTEDLTDAARQIKTDFTLLEVQVKGLGLQTMKGLAPNLSQSLQILSGSVDQTRDSFETFGWGVGITIKWIVAVIATLFDFIGTHIGLMVVKVDAGMRAFVETVKFNFDEANAITARASAYIAEEERKLRERIAARIKLASDISMPDAEFPPEADLEDPAEVASRKAGIQRAALQREISVIRAQISMRSAEEARAFDDGLQSLEQYYIDRRTIATEALAEELRLIEEQKALLGEEVDPVKAAAAGTRLDAQAAAAVLATKEEIATLNHAEIKDTRELGEERLAIEQQILVAQGERIAAQRLGFEEQIRQYDLILRQQGMGDAEREAAIARLQAALEGTADFEEAKDLATRALTELALAKAEINAEVDAGLKSAISGEAEILALEQERLVVLQELAAHLIAAAEATGDPAKIEAAHAYAASIREIGLAAEAGDGSLKTMGATLADATQSALADFFENGAAGAKNFKEKFQQMGAAILGTLKKVVAEMIAAAIMKKALGFFGGGGEVDTDFIGPMPAATGGLIRGRGTGTSDSILARLSNEEFVVRAAVVRQPLMLQHLREINRGGVRALGATPGLVSLSPPRFAEGGLVGTEGGMQDASIGGEITVGLDPGLVARSIETPEGQQVVLSVITNNKRAIRTALGV